ncbi:MAG TPA: DUF4040 domain-containing protein [Candidatus Baltobacteraceae bacterium]|nr:DUF4040 domain-containing protein [Candidatus Baltobacteraceae bacterium]
MSLLEIIAFLAVAVLGAAVVATRRPLNQVVVFGLFGASMALLFFVLQAPDVALSQIAVGSLAIPALLLVTLMKTSDKI